MDTTRETLLWTQPPSAGEGMGVTRILGLYSGGTLCAEAGIVLQGELAAMGTEDTPAQAIELIDVVYEELPPVLDCEAAMEDDSPLARLYISGEESGEDDDCQRRARASGHTRRVEQHQRVLWHHRAGTVLPRCSDRAVLRFNRPGAKINEGVIRDQIFFRLWES